MTDHIHDKNDLVSAWEDGTLGQSAEHAKPAPPELVDQIDSALGLQAISIRLPKDLIQSFKDLAVYHGMNYEPVMRDALRRFAECELKSHPPLRGLP